MKSRPAHIKWLVNRCHFAEFFARLACLHNAVSRSAASSRTGSTQTAANRAHARGKRRVSCPMAIMLSPTASSSSWKTEWVLWWNKHAGQWICRATPLRGRWSDNYRDKITTPLLSLTLTLSLTNWKLCLSLIYIFNVLLKTMTNAACSLKKIKRFYQLYNKDHLTDPMHWYEKAYTELLFIIFPKLLTLVLKFMMVNLSKTTVVILSRDRITMVVIFHGSNIITAHRRPLSDSRPHNLILDCRVFVRRRRRRRRVGA